MRVGKIIAGLGCVFFAFGARAADLRTVAEQSGFQRTGRYEEVEHLCAAFQTSDPKRVRCFEFGKSPEGRRMLAIALSNDGVLDARTARQRSRAAVLIQGGIHAGEIDGKDAGFLVMRELLEGSVAKGALSQVTFVFVPVFNVDGHERFGPNNRPNQVGPQEMGWRTTAQNLNLNRDYVKAEAPEMQAMLHLLNEWDPILYADLHVTDGADFEHDISVNVAPTLTGQGALETSAIALRDAMMQRLTAAGSLPLPFYPTLIRDDDPTSGFADTVSTPRFSHQYWSLHNRIGVLVETHSWKNYAKRVRATHDAMVALLELTAASSSKWVADARAADARDSEARGASITLAYRNTDKFRTIDFRGYRYTRELSPVSGALMTKYDSAQPQVWRVPLYYEAQPAVTVPAPRGGYIVTPAFAELVASKLTLHGVRFEKMKQASQQSVQTFRATKATTGTLSNEGRSTLTVDGAWKGESRDVPAGSLFVPIAQPRSVLAMTLLEPQSEDSLLAWGYFNTAFERKEYMEAYVAEQVALDMLKKDPALKAEFDKRVQTDQAFANSPRARLEFFYRRHASWDERYNLYPVYRLDSPR